MILFCRETVGFEHKEIQDLIRELQSTITAQLSYPETDSNNDDYNSTMDFKLECSSTTGSISDPPTSSIDSGTLDNTGYNVGPDILQLAPEACPNYRPTLNQTSHKHDTSSCSQILRSLCSDMVKGWNRKANNRQERSTVVDKSGRVLDPS